MSLSLIVDILIFAAFFVLNAVIGFRYYKGKRSSFREYAIGNKRFSTATLTATLVATSASGSAFFVGPENTYVRGLHYALATSIGTTASMLIAGHILGPRMDKFLDSVSLPDALGRLYGRQVQLITGISCVVFSVGCIAVQFRIMGRTLATLFHYEGPLVIITTAAVVTFYAFSGGIKAVTQTNLLQFFTFGTLLLPVLALTIWNNLQDQPQIVHILKTNPIFSLREVIGWTPEFLGTFALMGYFTVSKLTPEFFQRMAMAKDTFQVKYSMTWAAIICLGIKLCIIWITILLLTDQPGLRPGEVLPYVVNTHFYPGLKGLLGIGIMALTMSTADATINAAAVVIAHDVLPPLGLQKTSYLQSAKHATLLLGVLAVFLALGTPDLLNLILYVACFYAPIVVAPMLLAIFGFQTSRRVVLMAMGAGGITPIICLVVFVFQRTTSFFYGLLANLVTMLSAHYLLREDGGWGHNPPRDAREERFLQLLQPPWQSQLTSKCKLSLRTYLEHALPTEDYFYSLFGFYVFTSTYASFYLLPSDIISRFTDLYRIMQYSVMLLFTTFLAFPIWPSAMRARRFLGWFWPLCVCYALFWVGGTLVVISDFAKSQILIFVLNTVVAMLLLHWPVALAMAAASMALIILGFGQYISSLNVIRGIEALQLRIVYGLLLLSSLLIALLKHKQAHDLIKSRNKALSSKRKVTQQELVKALEHKTYFFPELTASTYNVLEIIAGRTGTFTQQIQHLIDTQQPGDIKHTLSDTHRVLKDATKYLKSVMYRWQEHIRLEVDYIMVDELLARSLAVFQAQYTQPIPRPRIYNTTDIRAIECDPSKIQQLLVNAWLYARDGQDSTSHQPIFVGLQPTTLGYPIASAKDYIKEIPALCVTVGNRQAPPVPKKLYVGAVSNTIFQVPRRMEELPLLDNQRIVTAHYGTVESMHEQGGRITQVYVLPIYLREVRPSMMDLLPIEACRNTSGVSHQVLPEEKALLARIRRETPVDMRLAETAIAYIKRDYSHMEWNPKRRPRHLHPIAATNILLNYTEDQTTILTTLLHSALEDTPLTLSEVGVVFGPEVATTTNKVLHLAEQLRRVKMNAHGENVQQLFEASDIRALRVKLADHLHNMRTMAKRISIEAQQKIAVETLWLFVPMARHCRLRQVEKELRMLSDAVIKRPPNK